MRLKYTLQQATYIIAGFPQKGNEQREEGETPEAMDWGRDTGRDP